MENNRFCKQIQQIKLKKYKAEFVDLLNIDFTSCVLYVAHLILDGICF